MAIDAMKPLPVGLLGIGTVIAPVMSGVFSAAGMLSSDVEHNFVRSILRPGCAFVAF